MAVQAPLDPGVAFSTAIVDILDPVTKATGTRPKLIFVIRDRFSMYALAVSLVSVDSADIAREIVEN